MLKDASTFRHPDIPPDRGAEWIHHFVQNGRANLSAPVLKGGDQVAVRVNHGRWIVDCPDCNGAQLACRTDHRFLCNECGNITLDGRWRIVIWPIDVAGIEKALAKRAEVNQNWVPGETAAWLEAEITMHAGRN